MYVGSTMKPMTGEQISRRRKRAGLSIEALADRVGVTATSLYRWERGIVKPARTYQRMLEIELVAAEQAAKDGP